MFLYTYPLWKSDSVNKWGNKEIAGTGVSSSKIFCSFLLSPLFFFKNISSSFLFFSFVLLPLQFLLKTLPAFSLYHKRLSLKFFSNSLKSQLPAFPLKLYSNSLSQLPAYSSFTPHIPIFRQRDLLMYSF